MSLLVEIPIAVVMATVIPFSLVWLNRRVVYRTAGVEFREIPLFWRLSISSGLLLGLVLLQLAFAPGDRDLGAIFTVPGPWEITLWELITQRVNPFAAAWNGTTSIFLVAIVAILLATAVVSSFSLLHWNRAVSVLIMTVVTTVVVAYVVFYVLCFVAWFLNKLNFWAIFLLLLFIRWPFRRHAHK